VYARDGAVVFGVPGKWNPGDPPTEEWKNIRSTFWDSTSREFLLGDFAKLSRFFSLAQASNIVHDIERPEEQLQNFDLAAGEVSGVA
jgi:hypothetical protein